MLSRYTQFWSDSEIFSEKVVYLLCCIQIHADLEVLGNVSFCCIQIHADLAVRCRVVDLNTRKRPSSAQKKPQ
ncbi:hypothetical protein Hanom_Chr01g00062921 [Helianthus anomalus]